jgi:hypothetical protein
LRELYCALEGITLSKDVPVVINTLEDVIFMDMNNDPGRTARAKALALYSS